MFKFRSGTHGLNEELGRHRGREGKTECSLCGNECENVSHVLWECSAYSSTRASFMKKLQELLEDDYEDFESLENVEKSSYVLGSELWESKFNGLLALVKEYIVDVWKIRKHKLYDSDSGSGLQLHTHDGLLALVKEYIVDVWKIRKHKLYDSDSGSGLQLHTQVFIWGQEW